MADRNREIRCCQCGLPLTGSRRHEIKDTGEVFCCTGCFLVNRITGAKGEEGLSQTLLGKFGLGLLLSMNVMLLSAPLYAGVYASIAVPEKFSVAIKYVLLGFSFPVMVLLGYPILRSSYISIKNGIIGAEALIFIGASSAFLISIKSTITGSGEVYYETATMILTLYTLGRYIDTKAKWRASESIRGLSSIVPSDVLLLKDDSKTVTIPVDKVTIGDKVLLKPGEMVPLDGIVVNGSALVDESFLTGESHPVLKEKGMEVFSGTLNIDGSLIIEVRKPVDDFVVRRIERLMERIREKPSRIKRIGDSIATYFVPLIAALSLGIFIYWMGRGEASKAVMRMLSILLISCPCAFGIAAPLAVWRGLGRAAEKGAIIMGAQILEGLSRVKTLFFDKTGTVTSNVFSLSGIYAEGSISETEILKIAASLELHCSHPLASSLVREAEKMGLGLLEVTDIRTRPGLGIEGKINKKTYYLGSRKLAESLAQMPPSLFKKVDEAGKRGSAAFLIEGVVVRGVFVFNQSLREGAVEAFNMIKSMGIRTVILTGDDERGVFDIKDRLCPDNLKWMLLPEDKVAEIEKGKKSGFVAMVGDGINDAPALEASHIGIAIGCGTELTRESARINLLGDDLMLIPYLIELSKRVRRKVHQNFFWAFFYNIIGIYLAVIGTITPLFAVVVMILSSLIVIANSTRL